MDRETKDFSWLVVGLALAIVCLALSLSAKEPKQVTAKTKGCTVAVGFSSLSVYYERVVVVGIKPTINQDTGEIKDEYWVDFPDRTHEKGQKAWNIPQDQFLKDGAVVMHKTKVCRCPQFFWGQSSGISADH